MADSTMLFITGTSYTGSTLLSFLLNGHPEITSIGEPTGPISTVTDRESYSCSCGAPLRECQFWAKVQQQMNHRGFVFGPEAWHTEFDLPLPRMFNQLLFRSLRSNRLDHIRDSIVCRIPSIYARLEAVGHRVEALVDSVLAVSGKRIFADAAKDPIRVRYLQRFTRFEPKVIHLVRDAPGFVSSAIKNSRPSMKVDLTAAIRWWNRVGSHVERLFAELPAERKMRVHYEDLCRDADGTLSAIASFASVRACPAPLDFRATEHHIIGNRMRLSGSRDIALDESWRSRLTSKEVATVLHNTSTLRRRFGYEQLDA